jgi:hypothetical protein
VASDVPGQIGSATSKRSPPLAIACVADTKPKYLFEALRLAQALSSNPEFTDFADLYIGVFPDAQRHFDIFIGLFREFGANIVTLGEPKKDHGPSNKLQILNAPELQSYDYVALVDCDMLPVKIFPEVLDFDGVQAKPADLNTVDRSELSAVFDLFSLPMPVPNWQTSLDRVPITCYCNTGCVIFSRSIFREFVDRWLHINDTLLVNKSVLGRNGYFLDQASFCVCVSTFIKRFRQLPITMNFPGHLPIEYYPDDVLSVEPQWLHYHNRVDRRTGALDLTALPNVQKTADAYNERSAAFRKTLAGRALFWVVYHRTPAEWDRVDGRHPEVQALVRCVIDSVKPQSILDLGCGTFSPNELDPFIAYHGIDCSGEAIRMARRKFPHYSYKIENFRVANITANADLVMMLDVIGTQADPWEGPLLMRVLTWANRAVLISARAPEHDTSEQAWEVFLTRLESVLPGFRKVGHVGTEIFLLKTL